MACETCTRVSEQVSVARQRLGQIHEACGHRLTDHDPRRVLWIDLALALIDIEEAVNNGPNCLRQFGPTEEVVQQ